MVSPNLELVDRTFQEMPPFIQGTDDSQHLLVMNLVVTLHRAEALGQESDRMPFLIFQNQLGKGGSGCEI